MAGIYKVPLVVASDPDGGYTVTSPVLPELITEGDTLEEALGHVPDALKAVLEIYDDLGKQIPENLRQDVRENAIRFEYLIADA